MRRRLYAVIDPPSAMMPRTLAGFSPPSSTSLAKPPAAIRGAR
ncbi:hypothetical protein [Archangium lansingense]|uniref:Uncharacterized protein n=1 Tax=Archangium lansingense TaxID=2995310 RepID=A0ABT3ZWY7_9BACT|nr:hypothetical protein [Archangium lansinium]MCY1073891.1 hypothetical protein [Archangium lansinium]